jgi:hypothetical protein
MRITKTPFRMLRRLLGKPRDRRQAGHKGFPRLGNTLACLKPSPAAKSPQDRVLMVLGGAQRIPPNAKTRVPRRRCIQVRPEPKALRIEGRGYQRHL